MVQCSGAQGFPVPLPGEDALVFRVIRLPIVVVATAVVALTAAAEPVSLDLRRQVVDGSYLIQHWDLSDGLPQASITDVAQCDDGFLWLATFGGLVRFDGLEFRSMGGAPTSVGWNPRVTALEAGADCCVWVGLENGGVVRITDGVFADIEQPDALRNATIWDLAEGPGGLIVAADRGSWLLADERWVRLADPAHSGESTGVAAAWDSEGRAWVGGPGGLYRFEPDGSQGASLPLPTGVSGLRADDRGGLWIGGHGVVAYAQGDDVWLHPDPGDGLTAVKDVVTDGEGDLWVVDSWTIRLLGSEIEVRGALLGGTFPPPIQSWSSPSSLRCAFGDRERNLWVGSDGRGMWRFGRQEFQRYGVDSGLRSPAVSVMMGDGAGGLWVATGCEGLVRMRGGQIDAAPLDLPDKGCCRALLRAADGALWVGNGHKIHRFVEVDDGFDEVDVFEASHAVVALAEEASGVVWAGTAGGGVLRIHDGKVTSFGQEQGLGGEHVHAVVAGGDGTVWFGHRSGSSLWREGSWTTYGEADGHPPGVVRAFLLDDDGTLWIGTYGGGLARFRGGQFHRYTTHEGLYDDVVSRILDDGQGWLWMNGNRGVSRVRRDDLEAHAAGTIETVRCSPFPTGEGNGGAQPAGWKDDDGRLWFPTIDGLVEFDSHDVQVNTVAPVLYLESALMDSTPLSLDGVTRVPPGHGDLEAHFTAASLRRPELVRFEYRLLGHDEEWASVGDARSVYYAQLPRGEHVIEFRAINEDDVPSAEPVRLAYHLSSHFYQTWWFTLLLAGALIAAGTVLGLSRARQLREHNRALRQEIRSRERVQAEKRELERRLANAQQLEALGRLAGGIAHDFNNTLTVVEGNADLLRLVLKPDPDTRIDRCIHEIVECSHRANRMIRQLLAFGRKQTLESEVLDPGEVVTRLQSMFRRLLRDDVELQILVEPGAGLIFADRSQAEQALANLLINAGDAMPAGGQVTVTVAPTDPEQVRRDHPAIQLEGEHVRISVEDSGEGIPTDVLSRIFEPFFSTKPVGQGTGLGLASVHGFVTQSAGHIGVVSEVDRGSRFDIYMPCAEGETIDEAVPEAEESLPWGSETILLCDDDDMVRESMAGVLEAQGYRVIRAEDGSRALVALQEQGDRIAALVTDVVMPEINGSDLALQARAMRPNIRVLFVTGYALDVELATMDDELADVLPKPFSAAALLHQLRDLLDR
jgi:signal transduction histidine kinase/ligand-binding sensor domain-containing protein